MAAALWASAAIAACSGSHASLPPASGRAVFSRYCSYCHSLIGNESLRRQGGDLVHFRMTRDELIQFSREMPTRRPLTEAQLTAVVAFVLAAQHATRR